MYSREDIQSDIDAAEDQLREPGRMTAAAFALIAIAKILDNLTGGGHSLPVQVIETRSSGI